MASYRPSIPDDLIEWITAQPMFFVATAAAGGRVNVSPKGLDSLRVLDPNRVVYLDLTGSGIETVAHVTQNRRITLMFCAFSDPPRIIRLYGTGSVHLVGSDPYTDLAGLFPDYPGARAIVDVAVDEVGSSCGFGVPHMDLVGQRSRIAEWTVAKGPEGLASFQRKNNRSSIDGFPGIEPHSVG